MKLYGRVIGIFSAADGHNGLPRPKQKRLILEKDYGILGDKFAGKDIDQTVMVVGTRAYSLAAEEDVALIHGSLGENILIDGDPHALPIGTRMHIGSAIVEITEACTLCDHLSVFDRKLPRLVRKDRGVYCRIVSSGEVTIGDSVKIER